MTISPDVLHAVAQAVTADHVISTQLIQSLWGGYGELFRASLQGSQYSTVIVKHIKLPQPQHHPRGWNSQLSHQRKLKSYQVERHWYQHFANDCLTQCPVPRCLHVEEHNDEILLIIEDLATQGFSQVYTSAEVTIETAIEPQQIQACLSWLAYFHAQHMAMAPEGLWGCGSDWHVATRPDELAALTDTALKQAAPLLDQALRACSFQTLIHGDAKLANFCFTVGGDRVAAVDFQYVGQGCGMKDVILLLSSCLPFQQCEQAVPELLNYYFAVLQQALSKYQPQLDPQAVENEWRPLYCVAWADFQRFIKGWSPGHWKINNYTERLTHHALALLTSTQTRSI